MKPVQPKLVKRVEAAAMFHVTPRTLAYWRSKNKGPRYVRFSRNRVKYLTTDVAAFCKRNRDAA